MKIDYPVITRFPFHAEKGKFYHCVKPDTGIWKRIECYMPGSPSTYGCTTMEQVAEKLLNRLVNGDIKVRRGLSDNGHASSEEYCLLGGVIRNAKYPPITPGVAA